MNLDFFNLWSPHTVKLKGRKDDNKYLLNKFNFWTCEICGSCTQLLRNVPWHPHSESSSLYVTQCWEQLTVCDTVLRAAPYVWHSTESSSPYMTQCWEQLSVYDTVLRSAPSMWQCWELLPECDTVLRAAPCMWQCWELLPVCDSAESCSLYVTQCWDQFLYVTVLRAAPCMWHSAESSSLYVTQCWEQLPVCDTVYCCGEPLGHLGPLCLAWSDMG